MSILEIVGDLQHANWHCFPNCTLFFLLLKYSAAAFTNYVIACSMYLTRTYYLLIHGTLYLDPLIYVHHGIRILGIKKACWLAYCKMSLDAVEDHGIVCILHLTYNISFWHTKQYGVWALTCSYASLRPIFLLGLEIALGGSSNPWMHLKEIKREDASG